MDEINYYLKENNLNKGDGKEYVAVVEKRKPVYQEELIRLMLKKNTTVTRQDIIVVLDLFQETVVEQSLRGVPKIFPLRKYTGKRFGAFSADCRRIWNWANTGLS